MRLKQIFGRKPKHRLYLGACKVLPSEKLAETWELRPIFGPSDTELERKFGEWLDLPSLEPNQVVDENDLVADVYLKEYRSGQDLSGDIGGIPLLFFWRPRAEVAAIISSAQTSKIVAKESATYKLPWGMFIRLALTPRALFLGVAAAGSQQTDFLIGNALISLFSKLREQI